MYEILLLNAIQKKKKSGGIFFNYVKFYVTKILIYIQLFFSPEYLERSKTINCGCRGMNHITLEFETHAYELLKLEKVDSDR